MDELTSGNSQSDIINLNSENLAKSAVTSEAKPNESSASSSWRDQSKPNTLKNSLGNNPVSQSTENLSLNQKRKLRRQRNAEKHRVQNNISNNEASTSMQKDHTANKSRKKPKIVSAGGGQLDRSKGQDEVKSSPKRMRSIETTPSNQTHEPKRRDKNTPQSNETRTFAKVVIDSHLVMGIVQFDSSNKIIIPIDKDLYMKIFYAINSIIFEDLDNSSFLPSFVNMRTKRDVLRVLCSDSLSQT